MTELLKAATEMFQAFTALAKYALDQERAKDGKAAPVEPKPEPRARKTKTDKIDLAPEKPADSVTTLPPVPPAAMSEKESEERLKVVGEAFVQRFSKQEDAVGEVKKLIESKFKVARLRDLVHAQRVELVSTLEARIKEIDSKATTSAPAAASLGL